jgi:hypothetical protein
MSLHLKRLWKGTLNSFWRRALLGLALLLGLFVLYRVLWLSGWYWPYRLITDYLRDRLPLAEPWVIQTGALLGCALLLAQAGTIVSFVVLGRHRRTMLYLVAAGALIHAALGWYSYGRIAVDETGLVRARVVERPDGSLKVIDRDYDPETGRRARFASDADLVMLDLQRRGIRVHEIGANGPFRSIQGTINVFYARRGNRIVLYSGPRHPDVPREMPLATEEVIGAFLQQERPRPANR